MLTCPCNENPLTPYFCVVSVYKDTHFFILLFALKHRSWVKVRTALLRKSITVPTIYVLRKNKKSITIFHLKFIGFTAAKNRYIVLECYRNKCPTDVIEKMLACSFFLIIIKRSGNPDRLESPSWKHLRVKLTSY